MTERRCGIGRACRHAIAGYWYYVRGNVPIFIKISVKKPVRDAAPCCALCAELILRSQQQCQRG
jgi:hypothetical protein